MIMEVKSKHNLPKRLYVCGRGLFTKVVRVEVE